MTDQITSDLWFSVPTESSVELFWFVSSPDKFAEDLRIWKSQLQMIFSFDDRPSVSSLMKDGEDWEKWILIDLCTLNENLGPTEPNPENIQFWSRIRFGLEFNSQHNTFFVWICTKIVHIYIEFLNLNEFSGWGIPKYEWEDHDVSIVQKIIWFLQGSYLQWKLLQLQ